ncbi:MAG TPA: hypothetical protein VHK88_19935 [Aquihabitans sp.]|jgi:hypothetical protein|nr:hypothetical protein [Aquihabitans sp.]
MTGGRTNPWRRLRQREQARLHFGDVHPSGRGRIEVRPDGTEDIYLDSGLGRRDRNAVLAHEVTHAERGVPPTDCPRALYDKEEETVRRITTDGLVPPTELAAFVRARLSTGDPVTVDDMVEHFDVPEATARHATWLAQIRPEGRGVA